MSHWLLAEKYYTISVEMPYIVHEVKPPKRKYCSRIALNWTMITLNVVFTLLNVLPYWYTTNLVNIGRYVPQTWKILSELNYFPWVILFLISDLILLNAVRKIRNFRKEHDESINTRNIWLHVTCFDLYSLLLLIRIIFCVIHHKSLLQQF